MEDIKITIKRLTDWDEVKDSTLLTVGKKAIAGKEISSEWKKNLIMSRHSPLRDLMFSIRFDNLPRWLADELRTHPIGVNPKMLTWRPDRLKNVDRHEQRMDGLTTYKMNLNAESILNISARRLCIGCAAPDMVKLWKRVVEELRKIEPELAHQCVPSCVFRGGCPEAFSNCQHFYNFYNFVAKETKDANVLGVEIIDIEHRYDYYNKFINKGGMV